MLEIYLVALGLGGTLVLASLVLGGGHGDFDADADLDMDADADADMDHDVGFDAVMSWLPVTSLRFWTFFLAFFGLTGAVLTTTGVIGARWAVATAAGGLGYLAGFTVVTAMKRLRKSQSDSTLRADDYVGASAIVMLPITNGKVGKVRLDLKGRSVELLAYTEDEGALTAKQTVMVYAVNDDGSVMVTRAEQPKDGASRA